MSRGAASRLLLVALLLLALTSGAFFHRYLEGKTELVRGRDLLLQGNVSAAAEIFSRHRTSSFSASEARAGLAVARALEGVDNGAARLSAAALRSFPMPGLLRRALREGRYDSCLRLIELGRRTGAGGHPVYEAAALVEQGRDREARAAWAWGYERQNLAGFESRVARALDLRRRGISHGVRDRHGRFLGSVDASGGFGPASEVPAHSVPRTALEGLHELAPIGGVRLAMDLELSRRALDALAPYRGSIVVLDPQSGDVLVAVSDSRTWAGGGTPALEQRREPASIAKIITTTAALRAGLDVDAEIAKMRCPGSVRLDGELLYCTSISGRLRGLAHAMAVSCNVAFAKLGAIVGRERLLEEYERYGFRLPSSAQEEGTDTFGSVLAPYGDDRQLADLAIGLDDSVVTPLHAALLAAVTANDGVMPRPRLFAATDGVLGLSPQPVALQPGVPVLDPSWLPLMQDALEAVAGRWGTASLAAPAGYRVAMKTGTASEPGRGFHVNYIGVAPLPSPRYAFAVRVTHQRTSRRVRRAALRVTRRLLEALKTQPSERSVSGGGLKTVQTFPMSGSMATASGD